MKKLGITSQQGLFLWMTTIAPLLQAKKEAEEKEMGEPYRVFGRLNSQ